MLIHIFLLVIAKRNRSLLIRLAFREFIETNLKILLIACTKCKLGHFHKANESCYYFYFFVPQVECFVANQHNFLKTQKLEKKEKWK